MKDEKGQIGNELRAAVILGAFVFAVIVYLVLSVIAGQIVGILGGIIVFALMFAFVANKIGKYERK
ncbi:hypothetical protein [Methanobacterium sp.]|uniref:hypothetical protein n=1 Tax=Methanobacterium sp. TaxID=2164 RepID=UPI003C724B95